MLVAHDKRFARNARWVNRPVNSFRGDSLTTGGRLASGVTKTEKLILCANCGRVGNEAAAKEAGWRAFSDGVGELHLFCALCVHREFQKGLRIGAVG